MSEDIEWEVGMVMQRAESIAQTEERRQIKDERISRAAGLIGKKP